jgi:hypothetical protein
VQLAAELKSYEHAGDVRAEIAGHVPVVAARL